MYVYAHAVELNKLSHIQQEIVTVQPGPCCITLKTLLTVMCAHAVEHNKLRHISQEIMEASSIEKLSVAGNPLSLKVCTSILTQCQSCVVLSELDVHDVYK